MRKLILGILSTTLIITSTPKAQANPAVAAPALCATGIGCVLVGTVLIGGVVYYVWQHRETGKKSYTRMYDRPGDSGEWDEPIAAKSREEAERKCKQLASKYSNQSGTYLRARLVVGRFNGKADFRCVFSRSH